jgi:hypothetical protein
MMTQLSDMLKLVNEERIHRKELEEKMTKTVENAIEKHALTNGHLTHQSVKNILHQHQQEVNQSLSQTTTEINDKMDHLINAMKGNGMNRIENEITNNNLNENSILIPQNNIMRNLHQWDGKFWHVPKCFQFPKDARRKKAWELLLIGQPNYKNEKGDHAPIMPFSRMLPRCLPKVISNQLKLNWRPIMNKMMEAPDLPSLNANKVNHQLLELTLNIATRYLQTKVCSYVWDKCANYDNCVSNLYTCKCLSLNCYFTNYVYLVSRGE